MSGASFASRPNTAVAGSRSGASLLRDRADAARIFGEPGAAPAERENFAQRNGADHPSGATDSYAGSAASADQRPDDGVRRVGGGTRSETHRAGRNANR